MSDLLRFTISTFRNVFETTAHHERVTLQELTRGLRRFQVKPDLQAKIDREMRRIDAIWRAWKAGEVMSGMRIVALRDAERQAREAGEDVVAAVFERYQQLKAEARRDAKKELRLWSPAIFRAGGRRTSEDVTHVSCLVLDYDDGTRVEQAIDAWQPWFHIVHTTWSHQHAAHRFRIVVPLAEPIAAAHWASLWTWAEARAEHKIDPSCKGLARTYALPCTAAPRAERIAFTHAGAIFNPVLEGILPSAGAPPRDVAFVPHEDGFTFVKGDAEATYVEQRDDPARYGAQPDDPMADDIWDGGAPGLDRFDAPELWDGGAPDVPLRAGFAQSAALQAHEPDTPIEPPAPVAAAQPPRAAASLSLAIVHDDDPDSGEVPVVDASSPGVRRDVVAPVATVSLLQQLIEKLEALLGRLIDPRATHGIDVEALERLAELHESGVLTRAEFRAGKQRILGGLSAA